MKDLIKFLRSTGVYLVGNVLTKSIAFFMLPLYTKYLDPSDFGRYDLYVAYITFLSSILFLDIWGGILRFMFDYKHDEDKAKPVVVGMAVFLISTVIYSILVAVAGAFLNVPYKMLLFLYGLTTNLKQVIGFVARAKGKNHVYAFGGLIGSAVNIFCNIIFIAVLRLNYSYLYIAYCIGMLTDILIVGRSIRFASMIKINYFDKKLFKDMLRFAAPLSLNSAAYWFLSSYNKVVISNKLSTVENGYYAVANKFSTIIQLFTQCFQMAWQELTFSKAGTSRGEMDIFYTKAVNEYIKFLSVGTILLLPFIKIIFPIMVDSAYQSAEVIVPFAIIATLLSCISSFLASIISTIKKNKYIFTTTIFGSIVNVILVTLLIGPLGVQAASVALAAGYFVIVVRRFMLLNKYLTIKLNNKMLALLAIIISAVCTVFLLQATKINAFGLVVVMCFSVFLYKDMAKKILINISNKIGR